MTSRGTNKHDSGFIGHLTITPPLNEAEREHLAELAGSSGTLRGTPTGRGDRDVPFARLGWEVCGDGRRLTWNPDLESSRMMLPTLRFLIDHLLRRGAKAHADHRTSAFTFDHVVDGIVFGGAPGSTATRFIEVTDNIASEVLVETPVAERAPTRSAGPTRRGRLPDNVIELRPRRA